MSQNTFQPHSATSFTSGDVLMFNPEGRTTSLGTREEGLARQAVYGSFIDHEALGRTQLLIKDLETRGANIESMRRELLGESTDNMHPVDDSTTVVRTVEIARNPNEYHVPGSLDNAEREAA